MGWVACEVAVSFDVCPALAWWRQGARFGDPVKGRPTPVALAREPQEDFGGYTVTAGVPTTGPAPPLPGLFKVLAVPWQHWQQYQQRR